MIFRNTPAACRPLSLALRVKCLCGLAEEVETSLTRVATKIQRSNLRNVNEPFLTILRTMTSGVIIITTLSVLIVNSYVKSHSTWTESAWSETPRQLSERWGIVRSAMRCRHCILDLLYIFCLFEARVPECDAQSSPLPCTVYTVHCTLRQILGL